MKNFKCFIHHLVQLSIFLLHYTFGFILMVWMAGMLVGMVQSIFVGKLILLTRLTSFLSFINQINLPLAFTTIIVGAIVACVLFLFTWTTYPGWKKCSVA